MRRRTLTLVFAAVATLAACKKTGENEFQVQTPDVDVNSNTATVRTPDVDVGTKIDTLNTPVVGTTKDTIIVDRPVVGSKKTEVRTPDVNVKRP